MLIWNKEMLIWNKGKMIKYLWNNNKCQQRYKKWLWNNKKKNILLNIRNKNRWNNNKFYNKELLNVLFLNPKLQL